MNSILDKRRAGVLLHITSLPSTLGFGSMGRHAYRFVDFLKECGLSVWQVLPIHPLHHVPLETPHRDFLSPYQPMSAFAGNPMLINLRKLIDKGWLPRMVFPTFDGQIEKAFEYRRQHLKNAYFHFSRHANSHDKQKFDDFVQHNEQQHNEQQWLRDYALFCALKDFYNGACWWNWQDKGHRNHDLASLQKFIEREDKKHCLNRYYFEQFAFFTQWAELKKYANDQGVYLFGDMPFFMARDSVEVWAHREYFQLDQDGIPLFLSGYPSKNDNFSPSEGQCWGHPLYDEEDFEWWLNRFKSANTQFDLVRLTHFQGFHHCWAIENSLSINPMNGELQPTLGRMLFNSLQKLDLPLIFVAEDIGSSEDVWKLRNEFQFHKMKLLQLAFDTKKEDYLYLKNPHLPHNHSARDVVYTGTHDSDTTKGWFFRAGYEERRKFVCSYLNARAEEMPFPIIRAAFQSSSKLAMVPMQDYLSLDGKCRMNEPGTSKHKNWRWQFQWTQITQDVEHKIKELVELYERG